MNLTTHDGNIAAASSENKEVSEIIKNKLRNDDKDKNDEKGFTHRCFLTLLNVLR